MNKWIAILATAGLLIVGAVAVPAISAGTSKTISGCVNTKSGVLRIADKCRPGERRMTWMSQSAVGEPGTQGLAGLRGLPGVDGQNGTSAYGVARRNGFAGTETEWLNSLKGGVDPVLVVYSSWLGGGKFLPSTSGPWTPGPGYSEITPLLETAQPISEGIYTIEFTSRFYSSSPNIRSVTCNIYGYDSDFISTVSFPGSPFVFELDSASPSLRLKESTLAILESPTKIGVVCEQRSGTEVSYTSPRMTIVRESSGYVVEQYTNNLAVVN